MIQIPLLTGSIHSKLRESQNIGKASQLYKDVETGLE